MLTSREMSRTVGVGLVKINVFDEAAGESRVFLCSSDILLSKMRYFRSYLKSPLLPSQQLEISVHCDHQIFEWLLNWARSAKAEEAPLLTSLLVLPVLIASNFLQMDELVDVSTAYLVNNIMAVCQLPCDVTGLPNGLFSRFSKAMALHQLELTVGTTDDALNPGCLLGQVVNKLYKYKLEALLRDTRTTLVRCSVCSALYSSTERGKLVCTARQQQATALQQGGLSPEGEHLSHDVDSTWRFQEYLSTLRVQQAPWRDIFWGVWSLVHVLNCHRCLAYFPAAELSKCSFHPEPPMFMSGHSTGRYPCCGGQATRSGSVHHYQEGCCPREHQVLPAQLQGRSLNSQLASQCLPPAMLSIYNTLLEFRHLVVPEEEGMGGDHDNELVSRGMMSPPAASPASSSGADEDDGGGRHSNGRAHGLSRFHTALGSGSGIDASLPQPLSPPLTSRAGKGGLMVGEGRAVGAASSGNEGPTSALVLPLGALSVTQGQEQLLQADGSCRPASTDASSVGGRVSESQTFAVTGFPAAPTATRLSHQASDSGAAAARVLNRLSDAGAAAARVSNLMSDAAAPKHGLTGTLMNAATHLHGAGLFEGPPVHSKASVPTHMCNAGGTGNTGNTGNTGSAWERGVGSSGGSSSYGGTGGGGGSTQSVVGGSGGNSMLGGSSSKVFELTGLTLSAAGLSTNGVEPSGQGGRKGVELSGISLSAAAQAARYAAAAAQYKFNSAASMPAAGSGAHFSTAGSTAGDSASIGGNRGSSGSGSSRPSVVPPARKLKLELLHEDDMARMGSLIKHLSSCRPPRRSPSASTSKSAVHSVGKLGSSSGGSSVNGKPRPTSSWPSASQSSSRTAISSSTNFNSLPHRYPSPSPMSTRGERETAAPVAPPKGPSAAVTTASTSSRARSLSAQHRSTSVLRMSGSYRNG